MKLRLLTSMVVAAFLVVACAWSAGCGGSDDEGDTVTSVAGTWNGVRNNDDGASDFTFVLTQGGTTVNGSYTDGGWSGVVSGQINGNAVVLTVTLTTVPPGSPMGTWVFSGTVAGEAMAGNLQAGANLMDWTCTRE